MQKYVVIINFVLGIVTDLYIDYNKFKGISAKSRIPKLLDILDNYNYEDLLYFFRPELNI